MVSQDGRKFFRTLTGIGSNSDDTAFTGVNAITLVDDCILRVTHAMMYAGIAEHESAEMED